MTKAPGAAPSSPRRQCRDIPASRAGGRELTGLILDIDATLVTCHSEKESAAPTYKHGFGYHPLLCFLDNTGEALAGLLRPGNATANTAEDHITVLDAALAQLPNVHRHGTSILIRADSAGSVKAFLARIRSLHSRGIHTSFSVGWSVTEGGNSLTGLARVPAPIT